MVWSLEFGLSSTAVARNLESKSWELNGTAISKNRAREVVDSHGMWPAHAGMNFVGKGLRGLCHTYEHRYTRRDTTFRHGRRVVDVDHYIRATLVCIFSASYSD